MKFATQWQLATKRLRHNSVVCKLKKGINLISALQNHFSNHSKHFVPRPAEDREWQNDLVSTRQPDKLNPPQMNSASMSGLSRPECLWVAFHNGVASSSSGNNSSRKTQTWWARTRGGPWKWSEVWDPSSMNKGWESWGFGWDSQFSS